MEHDDVICLDPSNGTAEDPITLSDDEEHHVEMKAFMVGRELAQRAEQLREEAPPPDMTMEELIRIDKELKEEAARRQQLLTTPEPNDTQRAEILEQENARRAEKLRLMRAELIARRQLKEQMEIEQGLKALDDVVPRLKPSGSEEPAVKRQRSEP